MTTLQFQHPKSGAKLKVIGAGLPRTGTNSVCAALQILLDGPCYHSGVQYTYAAYDEKHIRTLIRVAAQYPYTPDSRPHIEQELKDLLDGFVATADPPLSLIYDVLLRLYPDAIVMVTTRDRDSWTRAMMEVLRIALPVRFLYWWIPNLRWLPQFSDACRNIMFRKYGLLLRDVETAIETWERHMAELERVVPKGQLVYVDVKDGWEPLCKALDRPIPDIPFPRLNDAKDFESHFKKLAVRGLARWALFGVTLSAATFGALLIGIKMLETPPTFMERKSGLFSAIGGGLLASGALLMRYI
ncbi:hypothetical protein TI39_contig312g00019 [Zymoseptoria brevis]|uniref:Uncharacterized protein n=1 Tax=Zymoseptoria brevis TaxID=1047168 RepID=A0A0F4GTQ1_9PEZI|nr:hypothetical protein TI39_contig312g00019 [Zymoseptoria brevis]